MPVRSLMSAVNPLMLCILVATAMAPMPRYRAAFLARSGLALFITFVAAHINRWTHLWHGHEFFPSGHETFLLSVSTSIAFVKPRSLFATVPLTIAFGYGLVYFGWHVPLDILGAFALAPTVTWACHAARRAEAPAVTRP